MAAISRATTRASLSEYPSEESQSSAPEELRSRTPEEAFLNAREPMPPEPNPFLLRERYGEGAQLAREVWELPHDFLENDPPNLCRSERSPSKAQEEEG